ncbi:MAG TPA: hypothetical protein VGN16_16500 [Acidobacteriaceae bacterium]|jgi:hypothetical protein
MGRSEKSNRFFATRFYAIAGASLLAFALLTGCRSDEDKALDQAKAQAASTNTAQQIQYIDKNGDTVTTTVQPPVAGQAQQISTVTAPPAPGPKPTHTKPVVTPLGAAPLAQTTASGQPAPTDTSAGTAPVAMTAAPAGQQAGPPPPLSLTVPAGTELAIRVNQHISVKHSVAGERFTGEVVEPVSREGNVVIPRGTPVAGRIDEAHRRGHFKGRSILELRLTSMTLNGSEYALDTHDAVRTKKGKGKRSAGFIGGLTGAGMLIGGIASGGVGLAIGAASGAGAGTLIAGTTGNRDVEIPAESIVHFRLSDDLVVQNP